MVTNNIVRWGLHELEGSGYLANDAGSSDLKPTVHEVSHNVENRRSSDIQSANQVIIPPKVERRVEIGSSDIQPANQVIIPPKVERRVEIGSCDIQPANQVIIPPKVERRVEIGSSDIQPANQVIIPPKVERRVEIGSCDIQPANQVITQPKVVRRVAIGNSDIIGPVSEVVQPRIEIPSVEIRSSDIIPVDEFGEPLAKRVRAPFLHPESPPLVPPSTANDAVIALALHEEFQKLAAAEAAGQACEEKESVLVQTWVEKPGTSIANSSYGGGSVDRTERGAQATTSASVGDTTTHGHVTVYNWVSSNEDMDRPGAGSLSTVSTTSSSQDPYSFDEDDRQIALALSEDYQHVDKEVANRLTKLESMKHVPRTNQLFPTFEDASADHQRLADRLLMYGLTEQKIKGDGNCQFRALSDQLYRTPEHHKHVRKVVVKQLKANPAVYANYVPMKYAEYLKNMAKNSEWGDHVTLQAASDHFGVRISLITSFRDTDVVEIVPAEQKSLREIYLSFWAEVHYNSIYPIGGIYSYVSSQQQKQKRSWRLF